MPRELVVAVTGASGAIYAGRLLRALLADGHSVHLVLSKYGRYLLVEELGFAPERESVVELLVRLYGEEVRQGTLREYRVNDLACALASGTARLDGMVVVPCSMKTLAGISHGLSSNLIERAADVFLKERRPLVLVPRETPLSLVHLRNLTAATEAGALVVPAMPAFYQRPTTFEDLGDFIAGRVLDLLGIEHRLFPRWQGPETRHPTA
jgi:4-hydroxy-3-polyprenylbenzoate decarboxylase